MTVRREFLLRGPLLRSDTWLASAAERLLFAGITSTERLVRRRQLFTNIGAYGLALTAAVHFVSIAAR